MAVDSLGDIRPLFDWKLMQSNAWSLSRRLISYPRVYLDSSLIRHDLRREKWLKVRLNISAVSRDQTNPLWVRSEPNFGIQWSDQTSVNGCKVVSESRKRAYVATFAQPWG